VQPQGCRKRERRVGKPTLLPLSDKLVEVDEEGVKAPENKTLASKWAGTTPAPRGEEWGILVLELLPV